MIVQKTLVEQPLIYWIAEILYATIFKETLGNPPSTIWGSMAPFDQVHWTA